MAYRVSAHSSIAPPSAAAATAAKRTKSRNSAQRTSNSVAGKLRKRPVDDQYLSITAVGERERLAAMLSRVSDAVMQDPLSPFSAEHIACACTTPQAAVDRNTLAGGGDGESAALKTQHVRDQLCQSLRTENRRLTVEVEGVNLQLSDSELRNEVLQKHLRTQQVEMARKDGGISSLLGYSERLLDLLGRNQARGCLDAREPNETAAQDEAAMETSSTAPAITIEASTVPDLKRGKRKKKFGHAPPIASYRSHERDVNGALYKNRNGRLYYGPICDSCESIGAPHFHHPLRCDRNHRHWREPNCAPELNGVTGWTARTVKWASIGDPAPNRQERERNDQLHELVTRVKHLEGELAERHTSQTVGVEM